jgi:hypothetical protein
MPDNALSSLYPQPVAPNQGLLINDPAKVLGIVGQINSNALFQQQFNARKAIGQAYQSAIQPDGSIDTQTLMQGIKDNPDAGFMAGEASAGALSRQGQQIENASKAFGLQAGQNKLLLDGLGTLADKPKVTDDDLRNYAVTAARNSGVPTSQILSVLQAAPKDQAARKEWLTSLRNIAIGSAGTAERVAAPPAATGAPQTAPKGAINYAGGATPTGLPPGVGEAQQATGVGSGQALNDARVRGLNYRQEVFPLEQAIPTLEKLGKTGTGPGTEEFNHIKSFLQSAGIPGLDVDKIKNFDEAKKYLTDFVNQNGNTGTNDKLAASFAGNPSVNISNAAAADVAKSALALRRMKQAQLVEFEKSGKPDSDYAKWASQWQLNHDPRAFGFDLMKPDQRKKVLESISDAKGKDGAASPRDLFKLQVMHAHDAGIVKPPSE